MHLAIKRSLSVGEHAAILIRRIHDLCAHGLAAASFVQLFREAEACAYETREEMANDLGVPAPMLKYWMRRKRYPKNLAFKAVLMRLRRRLVTLCRMKTLRDRLKTLDTPPAGVIWIDERWSAEEKRSWDMHEAAIRRAR